MNKKLLKEIRDAIKKHHVLELAKRAKEEKNHPLYKSRNIYPDLPDFKITDADLPQIEELDNFPNRPLASERQWTPLEKFFYAVLWKDSKLKSIKLIIKGIRDALNDHRAAPPKFVYYYLGRHLTSRLEEPLVDRHTMCAWCLIQGIKIPAEFTDNDAKNYRRWFLEICKNENLKCYEDARLLDSLFFALGKYAKKHPRLNAI